MSNKKNNIVLVGFMGTGKSVVGRRLAKILKREFIDTDKIIEERAGKSISEIFSDEGEIHFRNLEADVIKDISDKKNCVIVTGGGAVIRYENINNLKKEGIIICLKALPEVIYKRVRYDIKRPLLQTENPLEKIKELLEYRENYYEKSDCFIDTSKMTVEKIVEEVLRVGEVNVKYQSSKSK